MAFTLFTSSYFAFLSVSFILLNWVVLALETWRPVALIGCFVCRTQFFSAFQWLAKDHSCPLSFGCHKVNGIILPAFNLSLFNISGQLVSGAGVDLSASLNTCVAFDCHCI